MCAAKYANLTSDLLVRNAASLLALAEESQAIREHATSRSALTEITTAPALIAVENLELGAKLLRRAMEFSTATIVFRIAVVPHTKDRVTLTLLGSSETFDYDQQQEKWLGCNGSTLNGSAELFDNPTDWSVLIRTDQCHSHSAELCRGLERHTLNLHVRPNDGLT